MGFSRRVWVAFACVAALAISLAGCSGSNPNEFNDAPLITSVSPANVTAGSQAFTLFINGSDFISGSRGATFAYWNNSPRSTTYNANTGLLQVQISASDVATPGLVQVTATNPPPGGGPATAMFLTVESPEANGPTISGFSPASIASGGAAFTLTVNGQNFAPNDVIAWNGQWRTTTFVNATQLTAQIENSDISTAVVANISVINSSNALIASPIVNFSVTGSNNPVPSIGGLSPSMAPVNSTGLEVFVNGSNFVATSSVEWNGVPVPTAYLTGGQLIILVPSEDLLNTGSATVTVVNPAPGGGTSGNSTFTVKSS